MDEYIGVILLRIADALEKLATASASEVERRKTNDRYDREEMLRRQHEWSDG